MSLQYPRAVFHGKQSWDYLAAFQKQLFFQRVILVLLPVLVKSEDHPPAGFPNKQQAGIELLRSFLEILKETGGLSLFLISSSLHLSSRCSIKFLTRFFKPHIPFYKDTAIREQHSLYTEALCVSLFIRFLLSHSFFLAPLHALCITTCSVEITMPSPIGAHFTVTIQLK